MRLRAYSHSCLLTIMITMFAATLAAEETTKIPERSEIDVQHRWATEGIFAEKAAWGKEMAECEKLVPTLAEFKGRLGGGADQLLKFLQARDQAESRIDRAYVYASLLADEDTRVGDTQAMRSKAQSLAIRYMEATSWVRPELLSIPQDTLDSWMRESDKLGVYRQYFDNLLRQKKHVLSPREEELLAMTGELAATPYNAYNLLSNADIKFPTIIDEKGSKVELSDSAYYLYMRSSDRRVRKEASDAIVGAHAAHRNTVAALLNGVVQAHIMNMKARGYDSCLSAALDSGNIPVEVYNTLVRTINDNLPLLHRYQVIRKDALRLEDGVHDYDLFAPFIADQRIDFTYDEGVKLMLTALEPLGSEYVDSVKKGLDSRWIDVYPTRGKRSGAYSSGSYLTQPYILLNYHGGYEDVSTLAHEMGHSVHSFFSRGTQPYIYGDYDIFCAEVASTCNEILLQDHILKQTKDPKRKLYLLGEFLEGMRGTVLRQTMFSEFEQRVHEMAEKGEPLTADSLGAEYRKIMTRYYGPAYTHDDIVDNYWVRIPHFYYNFYVYKYATSYCAASNIARRIMNGEKGAKEAYIKFLKAGSSQYPVDLLKMAGVDMTSPQPYEDAMALFAGLLDQTEELLKELEIVQ